MPIRNRRMTQRPARDLGAAGQARRGHPVPARADHRRRSRQFCCNRGQSLKPETLKRLAESQGNDNLVASRPPEWLTGAPNTYADIPKLGSPPSGDLGVPTLTHAGALERCQQQPIHRLISPTGCQGRSASAPLHLKRRVGQGRGGFKVAKGKGAQSVFCS